MLYINGTVCLSPQPTSDNSVFLADVKEYATNRIHCIDIDYSKFFDAGSMRRMGRIIKFGVAAGVLALRDAAVATPGAITTGTGYGLMDLSQKFLNSVIDSDETVVSPTSFIQSTHNTVSSNIALFVGSHAHNNTFAHRGFSFESALLDALLLANEGFDNILVGAYDEVSDHSYRSMKRLNMLRDEPCSNLRLFTENGKGTIAGEGAAFFVLAKQKGEQNYGSIKGCKTFPAPENAEHLQHTVRHFLSSNNCEVKQVDVVLSGHCGDAESDRLNDRLMATTFAEQTILVYKHLCGEYMTAASFATWLAARMMQTQTIPEVLYLTNRNRAPKTILIYNAYKANHSLLLLQHV